MSAHWTGKTLRPAPGAVPAQVGRFELSWPLAAATWPFSRKVLGSAIAVFRGVDT